VPNVRITDGRPALNVVFCARRSIAKDNSVLDGGIVPNTIGNGDGNRNGHAVVSGGLPGRIDGDKSCVRRHQAVFKGHLLNLAGQVRVGVVSSLVARVSIHWS